jgi:hypothetical protein
VEGGTLEYALGTDATNAPASGWSTSVPTATEPGTYYVWYRVVGDENHNDVAPACVVVTIDKPINPAEYSDFTLLASLKTSGKKALKLSWTAVEGAEGYDIFFGRSSASAAPYLTSVNGNEYTVKKLKANKGYRANVQAWRTVNGNKVYIGQPSPDAFAITGGKTRKFTNPKKISVKKKQRNVTLAAGKTAKIKAKVTKVASGKRFLKQVAKLRYFSSDRRIATVDAKGNVTAVGAGTCQVFAVAANGLRVGVNVTVK